MSKLPDGWRLAEIRDFASLVRRPVKVIDDEYYRQIGIRSHGLGIFHKEPITGKEIGNKRIFWVEPGDFVVNIVFAWEDAVALVSEAEQGMCASHRFPTIVVDKNLGDAEFLFRHFQSQNGIEQLKAVSPGGAGRNKTLNQSAFLKLKIPLPTLEEQKKIVAILSTWDAAIGLVEQLIAALGRRKQALMQLLLTGAVRFAGFEGEWEEVELGDVFSSIRNGAVYNPVAKENGLPISRIETISSWSIDYEKVGWAEEFPNQENYRLAIGDILFSHINSISHIGKVAMYMDETPLYHGMNLLRLSPNHRSNSEFIYQILCAAPARKYFQRRAKQAVNQASLNTEDVKSFTFKLPSLAEQDRITEFVRIISTETQIVEGYLKHLQEQKRGLMQQLLTGQVRV